MAKILHICRSEKFIPPFIDFIEQNFDMESHEFRLFGDIEKYPIKQRRNIKVAGKGIARRIKAYLQLIFAMHKAKKIILHGLFIQPVIKILWAMPWLSKKCYWVMWGADLYVYSLGVRNQVWKRNEFFRRPVIKNMGHFVTYIKGDYELVNKWYGAKGGYYECIMYPSNLYKQCKIKDKLSNTINILIGNSADPSNNHIEIFEKLEKYKNDQINIYAPLSYGDKNYAESVVKEGKKRFGDKFKPLVEFLSFEDYVGLLSKIDVAIFNHKRQQAMGNVITLLGLGKKVYMRSDVTQWLLFKERNIKVFDILYLDLLPQKLEIQEGNELRVKDYFSMYVLNEQLKELFN